MEGLLILPNSVRGETRNRLAHWHRDVAELGTEAR